MDIPVFGGNPLDLIANVFESIPEMVLVMDLESRFIYANKHTAKMFGYPDAKSMLGKNAYGMRCPAADSAQQFLNQDKRVIDTNAPIQMLDIHTYADEKPYVLLTKKMPLYDAKGVVIGTICHCREITNEAFRKLSLEIAESDSQFRDKSSTVSRSYEQPTLSEPLSKRELECLFFLIRGKTMIQISEILFISKRTVENHIANMKQKLNIKKKSQLIDYGISQGYLNIIPPSLLRRDISVILD